MTIEFIYIIHIRICQVTNRLNCLVLHKILCQSLLNLFSSLKFNKTSLHIPNLNDKNFKFYFLDIWLEFFHW